MEQQNQSVPAQQTIIIMGKPKSVAVAFVLTFLFGPLGLLYSSVIGGIVMILLGGFVGFITLGFGLLFVWPVCIIWAVVAANMTNKKISANNMREK